MSHNTLNAFVAKRDLLFGTSKHMCQCIWYTCSSSFRCCILDISYLMLKVFFLSSTWWAELGLHPWGALKFLGMYIDLPILTLFLSNIIRNEENELDKNTSSRWKCWKNSKLLFSPHMNGLKFLTVIRKLRRFNIAFY